jgi:ClpP class serine protease
MQCRVARSSLWPAAEIVMRKHSVLGPIDPQLGQSPAASLIKVIEQKPIAEIALGKGTCYGLESR